MLTKYADSMIGVLFVVVVNEKFGDGDDCNWFNSNSLTAEGFCVVYGGNL